jgi:arginyl-tRNA synthetase
MATATGSSVLTDLEALFGAALAAAFPDVPPADAKPAIAVCNNAANGDYQCNNAMALFGRMKGKEGAPKSPRDVAAAIVAALPSNGVLAAPPTLAGPGFINIRVSADYLSRRINNMMEHGMGVWAPPLPVRVLLCDG